jgi:hypothetical protein
MVIKAKVGLKKSSAAGKAKGLGGRFDRARGSGECVKIPECIHIQGRGSVVRDIVNPVNRMGKLGHRSK